MMTIGLDAAETDGALPPGPRWPRAVQAVLWTWHYAALSDRIEPGAVVAIQPLAQAVTSI